MSHLNQAQFNAARIQAEEIVKNVRSRIDNLNLRDDVMQKMLRKLNIEQLQQELSTVSIEMNDQALPRFQAIAKRANSYLSAIDSYIAYNFDLEVTDYQTAIAQMSEYLIGSSDKIVSEALDSTEDELLRTYIMSISKSQNHSDSKSLLEAANTKMQSSKLYQSKAVKNTKAIFKTRGLDIEVDLNQTISKTIESINQNHNNTIVTKEVRNRVFDFNHQNH
jgi:hypothetical protein